MLWVLQEPFPLQAFLLSPPWPLQEFLPLRLQERDVKWLTDNNLKTGECFLESAGQRVDASLSTRLELAKQSIIGDLHKQGANLV